jgi:hypothetical protein
MPTYEFDTHSLLLRLAQGEDADALSELYKFEERSGLREAPMSCSAPSQGSIDRSIREADARRSVDFTHSRKDSAVSVAEKGPADGRKMS